MIISESFQPFLLSIDLLLNQMCTFDWLSLTSATSHSLSCPIVRSIASVSLDHIIERAVDVFNSLLLVFLLDVMSIYPIPIVLRINQHRYSFYILQTFVLMWVTKSLHSGSSLLFQRIFFTINLV